MDDLSYEQAQPTGGDSSDDLPAPDPLIYTTYDGSNGPGKPGTPTGGVEEVVDKVKDVLS